MKSLPAWVLVSALAASEAFACPTCTCGNPALTTVGAEQLFVNRVRLASTLRAWAQWSRRPQVDGTVLRELRWDLSASWAPTRWLSLTATVPLQARDLTQVNLAREAGLGLGELELAGRFIVHGAQQLRPKALLSVLVGARLPTALTLHDAEQVPLSLDGQLGPGAFVPQLGLAWSGFFGDRFMALATLTGELPLEGRFGFRAGPGVGVLAAAQFQPVPVFAVRAGVELRLEGDSFLRGVADSSQAGLLGNALLDVILSPTPRLLLLLGVRVPAVDLRVGPVRSSPVGVFTVVVDV